MKGLPVTEVLTCTLSKCTTDGGRFCNTCDYMRRVDVRALIAQQSKPVGHDAALKDMGPAEIDKIKGSPLYGAAGLWASLMDTTKRTREAVERNAAKREEELEKLCMRSYVKPDEASSCIKTKGVKDDKAKQRYDLLDPEWLSGLADVATYGANKYTDDGWRTVKEGPTRYYAAAMRHLNAWQKGEEADPESGLPHLAHAAWNCLAVMSLSKNQNTEKS